MLCIVNHVLHVPQFRAPSKKIPTSMADTALRESEASVLATFEFLAGEHMDEDDDVNLRFVLLIYINVSVLNYFNHQFRISHGIMVNIVIKDHTGDFLCEKQ